MASSIPEPYCCFSAVTRSDSHGSGTGPAGFAGAADGLGAAAEVAGLATAATTSTGAPGWAATLAVATGFAASAGLVSVPGTTAVASGVFTSTEAASDVAGLAWGFSGLEASAGGLAPSGWGETESGPLLSSGIQCLSKRPAHSGGGPI